MSVSTAKNQSSLPPSERDFEIYRALAVDTQSTREVAESVRLSQTRVVQIRKAVGLWIAREVPDSGDLTEVQKVRLAEYVAEERFYAMYSESMSSWRRSQGMKTVVREGASGPVKTTREEYGETKFLQQALRITVAQATWWRKEKGVGGQGSGVESEEAPTRSASEGFVDSALQDEPAVAPMNPPVGDCSLAPEDAVVRPRESLTGVAASDSGEPTCDEIERRRREFLAALADDTSPVQPPVTDRNGMLLEDVGCISAAQCTTEGDEEETVLFMHPTTAGRTSSTRRPLNRRERRARQRKLEKALARAK